VLSCALESSLGAKPFSKACVGPKTEPFLPLPAPPISLQPLSLMCAGVWGVQFVAPPSARGVLEQYFPASRVVYLSPGQSTAIGKKGNSKATITVKDHTHTHTHTHCWCS
jgi:hypothetical protein